MIERAVVLPGGAFLVALCVALALTPTMRRLALDIDFVDRPGAHKSHHRPVPYMGGLAVAASFVAGMVAASAALDPLGVLITAAALGMCGLGLLDDDRTLLPGPRLLVQVGAAAVVVAAGVRIEVTGMMVYDLVLTMVWILGITNAVNFLDNMDGLAAGLAAAAAAAIFAIAVYSGDTMMAAMAASLFGACVGFLSVNARPAGIYLGDTGSLFVGFLLAVLAIEVRADLTPPASVVVPVLLVALPVLDITLVTISRLRRRISVSTGGRNHLSHRLVARGLSPGAAVAVLVGIEAIAGVLAVATAQGALPLEPLLLCATVVLVALLVVAIPAPVFEEPVQGVDSRLRIALAVGLGAAVLAALPASAALLSSRSDMRDGSRALTAALSAAQNGDAAGVEESLATARDSFGRADARLDGPLVSVGLVVPVVNVNLRAGRTLADAATDLASSAGDLALVADPDGITVVGGVVGVERADSVADDLANVAGTVRRASVQLDDVDQPFLLPPLRSPLDGLRDGLPGLLQELEDAESFARALGPLVGSDGDRRYLVVRFDRTPRTTPDESVLEVGHIVASDAVLAWEPLPGGAAPFRDPVSGAPASIDDPDFASFAGDLIGAAADARPLDGVIAVDDAGVEVLAAMSGADGSADDLSAVVRSLLDADLGSPARMGSFTGDAVRDGHILVHLARPSEQVLSSRSPSGRVSVDSSDSIAVAVAPHTDSAAVIGDARYDLELEPQSTQTRVSGRLRITIERDVADDGALPPAGQGTAARVTVRTTLAVSDVMVDGRRVEAEVVDGTALGSIGTIAVDVDVPDEPVVVDIGVVSHGALGVNERYAIDLPTWVGSPETTDVRLRAADGWRLREVRSDGAQSAATSVVASGLTSTADRRLVVALERDAVAAWQTLVLGRN